MSPNESTAEGKALTARGEKTRHKLLEAAEAVFGERGYEHASIAEITQRAGVAQGTFYIYFPDKLTVFVKLLDDLSKAMRAHVHAATQGLTHRLEVERAGLRAFLGFVSLHPATYRLMRQAEFVEPVAFKRFYTELSADYARGLQRGIEEKQLEPLEPEITAYALMGIADFLGMRYVLWEPGADMDRVVEIAMRLIRGGLQPK